MLNEPGDRLKTRLTDGRDRMTQPRAIRSRSRPMMCQLGLTYCGGGHERYVGLEGIGAGQDAPAGLRKRQLAYTPPSVSRCFNLNSRSPKD